MEKGSVEGLGREGLPGSGGGVEGRSGVWCWCCLADLVLMVDVVRLRMCMVVVGVGVSVLA